MERVRRFTFDSFVVGPGNRLAVAAARRVAEAPGTTHNPLFIYSGSGLGKTHLLGAIGQEIERRQDGGVVYETVEHLMDRVARALEAGQQDVLRSGFAAAAMVLLDDVQFLAGRRQVQEELIRSWDWLTARGVQVVLTSDRPPQDIDALDERLLRRLSGGLLVDIGAPDYETRVAIARRMTGERGQRLSDGVYLAVARLPFHNVRELQGALNRLLAVQELEGRLVTPDEIHARLGAAAEQDPDRTPEAETLLARVRKRHRPSPPPRAASPPPAGTALAPAAGAAASPVPAPFGPERAPREWPYIEHWLVEELD
jgi:chromosomal replication initiator protein